MTRPNHHRPTRLAWLARRRKRRRMIGMPPPTLSATPVRRRRGGREKAWALARAPVTPADREAEAFGDPLETLWKKCIFGLCGVSHVVRRMYAPVSGSTPEQR